MRSRDTTPVEVRMTRMEDYFQPDQFPILVIDNPHHGQTSLHRHEFYELVFIDRGITLHSHDGRTEILTAGDYFLVLPGETHGYLSTNDTALYNCLFKEEAFQGLEREIRAIPALTCLLGEANMPLPQRAHAGVTERQEIVLGLNRLIWELTNRPLGWELRCKALLLELLVSYARLRERGDVPGGSAAGFRSLLKAVALLEADYRTEPDLQAVAKAAGMSLGYLTRQFKNSLGTTPAAYARNFRMAKAAELLRDPNRSVSAVAAEMGFSDITLFSRQFRQVTGLSPSGFRRGQSQPQVN